MLPEQFRDRLRIRRAPHMQGSAEGTPPFGRMQAFRRRVQPRTPSGQPALRIG